MKKMYVVKEPHKMLSGFITFKFRWWFKDENGEIEKFPAQIQHSTEVNLARKKYLDQNKEGKVYFKDMTK